MTHDESQKVIETVNQSREASTLAWDAAIEGAERDGHDLEPVVAAKAECLGYYADAIWFLKNPTARKEALTYLEWAAQLEREWGDSQHAARAIVAVRGAA